MPTRGQQTASTRRRRQPVVSSLAWFSAWLDGELRPAQYQSRASVASPKLSLVNGFATSPFRGGGGAPCAASSQGSVLDQFRTNGPFASILIGWASMIGFSLNNPRQRAASP